MLITLKKYSSKINFIVWFLKIFCLHLPPYVFIIVTLEQTNNPTMSWFAKCSMNWKDFGVRDDVHLVFMVDFPVN